MRMLTALCFVLICLPANAQDSRIKIADIAKGSSVTFLMSNNIRTTHHFEGPVDEGYLVTFWKGRGKGLDGGIMANGIFNADGRMVRYSPARGTPVTYTPHNCLRVVGTCRYTATSKEGRTRRFGRTWTPEKNGGYKFRFFEIKGDVEATLASVQVTLDDMGMMQTLDVEEDGNGKWPSMKQEHADYR
ncbi:MAG: hypothetical protein AAFO70_05705 [Pseudomonadota bacterium]